MVLYFSATGNTEFVANEIANGIGDECLNLLDKVKNQDYSFINSDKPYIICAPVYVCEMPRFMAAYLKKIELLGNKEVYFVFTSGGYAGISGQLAEGIVKKKDMIYKGHAEVKMPRNYVANDHYPMLEVEEIENRIKNACNELSGIIEIIKTGGNLTARHIQLWETVVTVPFNPVWCKLKFTTKDFYTIDKCVGCGKCEKLCPLNNVKVVGGEPIWGDNCTHCMACIGNCPTAAIKYGDIDKEPYNFGKYKYIVDN